VAVLVLGLGSTGAWARRTAKRKGERLTARPLEEVPDDRTAVAAH
jgi:hypothetical protein